MKLYHLVCYLIFQLKEKNKSTRHKRISAERIQCKDIKFINMKEVIPKIGMQGSVSRILNNVGKLILKEFLNIYIKHSHPRIAFWPKLVFQICFCMSTSAYVCI